MEVKEIQTRLEITKLATTIGDHESIMLQNKALKEVNSSKLNEIIALLEGKNYRQALYLIKNYLSDMGTISEYEIYGSEEEGERVLDIEDMLRMSPLAKDTIKDYKRSIYTDDDLETFAKNIEKPISQEYEPSVSIKDSTNNFMQSIEEEAKENIKAKAETTLETNLDEDTNEKLSNAINSANVDTPLDEISAEVLGESKSNSTKKVSKYKTLREKFARKESKESSKELKTSNVAKTILSKVKKEKVKNTKEEIKEPVVTSSDNLETTQEKSKKPEVVESKLSNEEETLVSEPNAKSLETNKDIDSKESVDKNKDIKESITKETKVKKTEIKEAEIKETTSKEKEDRPKESKLAKIKKIENEKKDNEIIYSPIPHIEQKFRQAFILYPPIKESDMWVEDVVRFLKMTAKNSFTQRDVKILLDEYRFYLDKKDIAKASQILLLAASTDSNYAQFILARELFSGNILVRDLKKSFELMKSLANEFYPDAVCDLAQFYEYGIGVPKDKAIAIKLYEKAFQLGVERATKHINRLKESNSFLSTIFKLK
jgi:hypothetical protein